MKEKNSGIPINQEEILLYLKDIKKIRVMTPERERELASMINSGRLNQQQKDEMFPDFMDLNFEFFEEDDEDEIELIKLKSIKPTFDEVFDKIADMGINSLNEEEKLILNQYTK